jgi:hypothetical protein
MAILQEFSIWVKACHLHLILSGKAEKVPKKDSTMLRTSKRKGSLQVMLMALVVLVIGITAPGYGDDDHDDGKNQFVENYLRLSGPALEGTLTLIAPAQEVIFHIVKCKGVDEDFMVFFALPTYLKLANFPTAKSLEGLLLPGVPTSDFPTDCLRRDQTAGDSIVPIVTHVKRRTFANNLTTLNADVVLLQVVQRSHKDKDEDRDRH